MVADTLVDVILTPKAEGSSEILYCKTRLYWILRYAQDDERLSKVNLAGKTSSIPLGE